MRKAIIIVILISVLIVSGFILLQKLTSKGLEYAEKEKERVEAEKAKAQANMENMENILKDKGYLR